MKALVCELCGGNDFVKTGDFFVCQSCGTKYTAEDAKKMMIEGTVDVSGSTVKIDTSNRIANLYEMARRENGKFDGNALKYYEEIVVEKPNDWEANFYISFYKAQNSTLGSAFSNILSLLGAVEDTFKRVKQYEPESEHERIYTEVKQMCSRVSIVWRSLAETQYKPLGNAGAKSYIEIASMTFSLDQAVADNLIKYFDNKELALTIYKDIITNICKAWNGYVFVQSEANEIIEKIKKYEPDYVPPQLPKKSGCYVATCVYGSYDCPEVWTLRRYRDYTLAETWYGRAFIHIYYAISPTLVKWFGETKWFKNFFKPKLDKMVDKLNANGVEDTPYNDRNW